MTITEFLEARIAEDEAEAKWVEAEGDHGSSPVQHPSRVLAECAAKRAMVDLYRNGVMGEIFDGEKWTNPLAPLAAAYKDHADYREDWAL